MVHAVPGKVVNMPVKVKIGLGGVEFWEVVDFVLESDPRVRGHLYT